MWQRSVFHCAEFQWFASSDSLDGRLVFPPGGPGMRTGQCVCGAAKIAAEDVEPTVVACHCADCQRRTGSPFGVSAYYPASAVSVSGSTQSFTRSTDSGGRFTNVFCPVCGSTLYWTVAKYPDIRGVPVGVFALGAKSARMGGRDLRRGSLSSGSGWSEGRIAKGRSLATAMGAAPTRHVYSVPIGYSAGSSGKG